MRIRAMKERFLKEESGFTLPELMVTMLIMIIVMFALYSIFDMSIRVFSFGNRQTEAVENSRAGLERMERELRAAYPVDRANNLDYLFFNAGDATKTNADPSLAPPPAALSGTQSSVTFGNDLDGNGKVQCPNTNSKCEYITYKLSSSGSPRNLLRNNTATGSISSSGGDPLAEYVRAPRPAAPGDLGGLKFTFCRGVDDCPATINESEVRLVRITLEVVNREGKQTLTTAVALRNPGALMFGRLVREESGMAMGLAIMVMVIVGVMGAGLLTFVVTDLNSVVEVNRGQRAFEMADAGVKAARAELIQTSQPSAYDGASVWAPTNGGKDISMDGDRANVQVEYRLANASFRVVSTGYSPADGSGAIRKVEAIYTVSSLKIPKAYFTQSNLKVNGDVAIDGISLFARGNADVGGSVNVTSTEDIAYKRWAETGSAASYPNPYNSTPRAGARAGFGVTGMISTTGSNAASAVAKGTRSYDSTTNPRFVADYSADGNSGQQPSEIGFPFPTGDDPEDIETLRQRAIQQEQETGVDYYREVSNGSHPINSWPSGSTRETVVFYKFDSYSNQNQVSWLVNGNCSESTYKGVIVVENGNFELQGGKALFNGLIAVRAPKKPDGTYDPNQGTYEAKGDSCLRGYANATGDITLGGGVTGEVVDVLGAAARIGGDVQLRSWRELYE